jgi:hypothetical protein
MAIEKYPIFIVGEIAYTDQTGVHDKAWVDLPNLGRTLFKESSIGQTDNIQTDWSEKVAYELAKLLCLPAARYELAEAFPDPESDPIRGSISIDFALFNAQSKSGEEFLGDYYPDYVENYPASYSVERILDALAQSQVAVPSGFDLPPGIDSGAKNFVGSLMLDNLISNCDRHDQNFEIQILPDGTKELAPTFDQGQALGATLNDEQRQTMSTVNYQEFLEGSFYDGSEDVKPPKAFQIAANRYPEAAAIWQERLARITPEQINEIFDRLPADRITPIAKKFAKQVINDGREQILSLDLSPKLSQVDRISPLQDLNDIQDRSENDSIEQHPGSGSLADINNLQSDDTQIAQRPTDGTLADLNLSDESNVESSAEDDDLGDADRLSL